MILHLAFTCCLLGLTVLNYYVGRRNVLYPAFLFSLVWLVGFCLYMVPLVETDELAPYTLAVVVSCVVFFSAGAAIFRRRVYPSQVAVYSGRSVMPKRAIFFYCLAVLPVFFWETQRLSAQGGVEGLLASARVAIIEAVQSGEKPYENLVYSTAATLAMFVAFVFLIEAREWRKERAWVWGSILVALAYAVLSTGRTMLLALVSGLVGIYLLKQRRFSAKDAWRFVRWPLAIFLVLFSVLVPFTENISRGSEGPTATGMFETYVFGYAVLPLAAFNHVLLHPSEYKYDPNHTFSRVLPILARFSGVKYIPPPIIDDYVWVPLPANVYTALKFYYVDFGLSGMLVAMFLIGASQTWLFRRALAGEHFYIFLFALSFFPLLMVAFDDQYSLVFTAPSVYLFSIAYFQILRAFRLGGHARLHSPGIS